jgi:hypothetical protein
MTIWHFCFKKCHIFPFGTNCVKSYITIGKKMFNHKKINLL